MKIKSEYSALVIICYFLFCSCTFFYPSVNTSCCFENDINIFDCGFSVDSIICDKNFQNVVIEENAAHILKILVPDRNENKKYSVAFLLKEENFVKDFDFLNICAVEAVFKNKESGTELGRILVAEETKESLISYPYLFKLLKKTLKKAGM